MRGAVYALAARANGAAAGLTAAACRQFLAQPSIVMDVFKKGKMVPIDVRPYIRSFRLVTGEASPAVAGEEELHWDLVLQAGPSGSVRPQAIFRRFLEAAAPAEALAGIEATLQVTRAALEIDGTA